MRPQSGCCQLQTGTYHDEGQAEDPDLGGRVRPDHIIYIVDIGITYYYTSKKHAKNGRKIQTRNVSKSPTERIRKNDKDEKAKYTAAWKYHVTQQEVQNGPGQEDQAAHSREPEEICPR